MLLSIIIVSYNTKELTLACLESCLAQAQKDTEILVVDNNSQDGSLVAIGELTQKNKIIKLIKSKKNLGFAKANNLALKQAKGEYLLLLNSDTLLEKKALENLIKTFTNFKNASSSVLSSYKGKLDNLGILSAKLLNSDKTYQPQGGDLPNLLSLVGHYLFLDKIPFLANFVPSTQHSGKSLKINVNGQKLIQKGWVAGTAMMIKREVLDEIGNLDENIFMYAEDVEYCLRAQKHHYDIAINPQAKIIHFGSASSNKCNAILGEIKGYLYIFQKHFPVWQLKFLKLILFAGCYLRIFIFATMQDKQRVACYKKALKELE